MSESLGHILKEAREKKGLTLEQLATMTKLNIKFVEALEMGRRDLLPGNMYLKPFTKTCAEALGLDIKELYQIIDGEMKGDSNNIGKFELDEPKKKRGYKLPIVLIVGVFVIAVIMIAVSIQEPAIDDVEPVTIVPADNMIQENQINWSRPWQKPITQTTSAYIPSRGLLLVASDSVLVRLIIDSELAFHSNLSSGDRKIFDVGEKISISLDRNDCIEGYLDGIKVAELGKGPGSVENLELYSKKE